MKKQGYQPKQTVQTKPPNKGSSIGKCFDNIRTLALENRIRQLEKTVLRQ